MAMIDVNDLVKEFRQYKRFSGFFGAFRSLFTQEYSVRSAVDRMSFSIEQGEAVGYVGPNGAGKSTMIKMLTGILVPTSGQVLVNGLVPHISRKENAKRMGVVFGQRSQLWWDLPVMDSFDLSRYIYQIPDDRYRENVSFCEELLGLSSFIQSPVRQLSLGQRMRAEIALALLHDPDILYLDEPTIGLDVMAKDRIRDFLRRLNREKRVTIILTTHDLKDIEEVCPRLLIVNRGRLVYDGTVAALKATLGNSRTIVVEFEHDPGSVDLPGAQLVKDEGRRKHFRFNRNDASAFDLLGNLSARYPVEDVALEDADIEEVIRTLYKRLGEEAPEQAELDTWTRGRAVTQ